MKQQLLSCYIVLAFNWETVYGSSSSSALLGVPSTGSHQCHAECIDNLELQVNETLNGRLPLSEVEDTVYQALLSLAASQLRTITQLTEQNKILAKEYETSLLEFEQQCNKKENNSGAEGFCKHANDVPDNSPFNILSGFETLVEQ